MADEPKVQDDPKEEPKVEDQPVAEPQEPQEDIKEEPSEETKTEDVVTTEEPEETEEQPPEPEEAPHPSRAERREENLRIRNLIDQLKSQPQTMTPKERQDALDYEKSLEADPAVIEQLEADRKSTAEAAFNQGIEQARSMQFHTRLDIDMPRVHDKYSFLDPTDKENFNPGAADAINQWYIASVGYDPKTDTVKNSNLRYSDFVEGLMELADGIAGKKSAQTAKNIVKQAANTGLRPDGSAVKGLDLSKHPKDMTNEELAEAARQEAKALRK